MPLYEYQCNVCSRRFELIQKFSDPLASECPTCGGPVRKLFSSPAIQFKGSLAGTSPTTHGRVRRIRRRQRMAPVKPPRARRPGPLTPARTLARLHPVTPARTLAQLHPVPPRPPRRPAHQRSKSSGFGFGLRDSQPDTRNRKPVTWTRPFRSRAFAGILGTVRQALGGAGRSRRRLGGSRSCCRCRGGFRRFRRRRAAAAPAVGAARW